MSTLSVDSINGQTVASKVSIPGHIVGAAVSQITGTLQEEAQHLLMMILYLQITHQN